MDRILSVSYMPGDVRHLPSIRIQGLWLLRSGFSYGDKVRLVVADGYITITKIRNEAASKEEPPRYVQKDLYDQL